MSRKHRWILGVGGLIGLGGVGFFLLNRHLNLVPLPALGGAANRSFNSRDLDSSSKRVEFKGNSMGSLDLGNLGSSGGLHSLELNPDLNFKFLDDGLSDSFDVFSSSSAIKNIFSEIFREGQVTGIDKDILKTYEQMMSGQNLHDHVKNFQSIKGKVQGWVNKGGIKQKRDKSQELPALTAGERVALRDFYYLFSYLTQQSQHYHSRLYDAGKDSSANIPSTFKTTSAPELRDIQKALNDMQWDREKVKVQVKYLTPTGTLKNRHPKPYKENSYGWGNWARNPFRHFFGSKEEYEKIMEESNNSQQALEEYVASKRAGALFGFLVGIHPDAIYGDLSEFKKGIEDPEHTVEYQVAKSLFEWMGKLNTKK